MQNGKVRQKLTPTEKTSMINLQMLLYKFNHEKFGIRKSTYLRKDNFLREYEKLFLID